MYYSIINTSTINIPHYHISDIIANMMRVQLTACNGDAHLVSRQIDLIDDPIRRMAINRWMDRFLNDVGHSSLEKHSLALRRTNDDDDNCNTTLALAEIGADHCGDQPPVPGRGGGGGGR